MNNLLDQFNNNSIINYKLKKIYLKIKRVKITFNNNLFSNNKLNLLKYNDNYKFI